MQLHGQLNMTFDTYRVSRRGIELNWDIVDL
jgi:hypothetical protein